jgi:hypothetical protein
LRRPWRSGERSRCLGGRGGLCFFSGSRLFIIILRVLIGARGHVADYGGEGGGGFVEQRSRVLLVEGALRWALTGDEALPLLLLLLLLRIY